METLIKQTRELGTSAGVLLPRKWLNKQVVVTLHSPSKEEISQEVMKILFKQNLNEEAKGIYLYGSYAREDQDFDSDIDVLVLTKGVNKLIKEANYEITLVSEKNFLKNLPQSLNYSSLLREAKVIINKELIERYLEKEVDLDLKGILKEIEGIIRINNETITDCEKNEKPIPDGVAYSIVLRLRELYLIRCIISKKQYKKIDFKNITGEKAYSAYNRVKLNEKDLSNTDYKEIRHLLDLSLKWVKELKE